MQWLAMSPHSKRVLGSNPPAVCSLHILLVGTLVLRLLPTIFPQRHAGDSKSPVGVNVNGCLSLYVGPVTDWGPVQGVPCHSPNATVKLQVAL